MRGWGNGSPCRGRGDGERGVALAGLDRGSTLRRILYGKPGTPGDPQPGRGRSVDKWRAAHPEVVETSQVRTFAARCSLERTFAGRS